MMMTSEQIENWADELLGEYKDGRRELKHFEPELAEDKKYINSMIGSMTYSIDWMETGRQPDLYRGVDRKNAYRTMQYDEMEIIPDITEQIEREALYMDQEQRRSLLKLFRNFSEREMQCYLMYEAEQLSMQKIADRLGIKKSSVQMYIKRAKEKVLAVAS